jgi:hypothetical protein
MWYLYLDESGDLGFDFVNKTPSKLFVITILAIRGNDNNRQLLKGVAKTIKRKLNPKGKRERIVSELKGTNTTIEIKKYFYDQIKNIDFEIYSITLNKRRVYDHLTRDKARVYNYIARLLLDRIPIGDATTHINFLIDKSKGKREITDFNNYIQTQLKAKIQPTVPLFIDHQNSCENYGLQAVDMFCYGIFQRDERRKREWYNIFKDKVAYCTIYLPPK